MRYGTFCTDKVTAERFNLLIEEICNLYDTDSYYWIVQCLEEYYLNGKGYPIGSKEVKIANLGVLVDALNALRYADMGLNAEYIMTAIDRQVGKGMTIPNVSADFLTAEDDSKVKQEMIPALTVVLYYCSEAGVLLNKCILKRTLNAVYYEAPEALPNTAAMAE